MPSLRPKLYLSAVLLLAGLGLSLAAPLATAAPLTLPGGPPLEGEYSIPGIVHPRTKKPLDVGATITALPNGDYRAEIWVEIDGVRHVDEDEELTIWFLWDDPFPCYAWENPAEDPAECGLGLMCWNPISECWESEVIAGPHEGEVRELHPRG